MLVSVWVDLGGEVGYHLPPGQTMRVALLIHGTAIAWDFARKAWSENATQSQTPMVRQASFGLTHYFSAVLDVEPPTGGGVVHAAYVHPVSGVIDSHPATLVKAASDTAKSGATVNLNITTGA
jgi:hypothetical protein